MTIAMSKLKYWISRYLLVFGGCWLFFEPTALFFDNLQGTGWYGYIGIIIIALILTIVLFYPKNNFTITLPESDTRISISVSDILEQQGSIIIGTNDTFDTELGEIINPNSLQGQLLTDIYQSDRTAFDLDINNSLKNMTAEIDNTKSFGKNKRYPIGTVANIQRNNNKYFLIAFNKMHSDRKQVTTDISDLWFTLSNCWNSIRENGNHKDIHVPIIGSKFARTGLSFNILIQLIIMSFVISIKQEGIAPSLTIHVYKTDVDNINFIVLKSWLDCLAGKE